LFAETPHVILQAESCDVVVPQGAKASAAMYWRLQMIEQSIPCQLFFRGAHGVYGCTAYHITQISAQLHSDDLGLLPTDFYLTFDNFRTVGRCRLAWRYQAEFEVVFENWFKARENDLREGDKVRYDVVPNKGKESAENLKVT
jgi:hypothetical protein